MFSSGLVVPLIQYFGANSLKQMSANTRELDLQGLNVRSSSILNLTHLPTAKQPVASGKPYLSLFAALSGPAQGSLIERASMCLWRFHAAVGLLNSGLLRHQRLIGAFLKLGAGHWQSLRPLLMFCLCLECPVERLSPSGLPTAPSWPRRDQPPAAVQWHPFFPLHDCPFAVKETCRFYRPLGNSTFASAGEAESEQLVPVLMTFFQQLGTMLVSCEHDAVKREGHSQ